MNKGDIVKRIDGTKVGGTVKYVTCFAATKAGGATCDKKLCNHVPQDYVFVSWPVTSGGGTSSMPENEVELDVQQPPGAADQILEGSKDENVPVPVDQEKELAVKQKQVDEAIAAFDQNFFDGYNGIVRPKARVVGQKRSKDLI